MTTSELEVELDPRGIGRRIRERREELEYSQADVASVIDWSQSYVSQWENGNRIPTYEQLEALAVELAVSVAWLLTGDPDGE